MTSYWPTTGQLKCILYLGLSIDLSLVICFIWRHFVKAIKLKWKSVKIKGSFGYKILIDNPIIKEESVACFMFEYWAKDALILLRVVAKDLSSKQAVPLQINITVFTKPAKKCKFYVINWEGGRTLYIKFYNQALFFVNLINLGTITKSWLVGLNQQWPNVSLSTND